MSASPLSLLRSGPPPPKVVLLPDALFFNRAVPIAAGATPAEAASQVELALEAMSPFPLAQLYYGWFWTPDAPHAFVYAAYRRRFTTEQTAAWANAELVIPTSVALLGGKVQPATTLVLATGDGLTAIHWESPLVPSSVVFRPLAPEATEEDRARVRDELLRSAGGSRTVVDLLVPPAAEPGASDREVEFRSGDFVSRLPTTGFASLDVRDKTELATLRAGRQRDLVLWRVTLGCAAALVLLLVGELALVGASGWQKVRLTRLNSRAPTVQKIKEAQDLATSIQDLVTKRFLPLEMLTTTLGANADRKPSDILVTRVYANTNGNSGGTYTLTLELQTRNAAQVPVFRNELQKLPQCDHVELQDMGSQPDRAMFRLIVTFKPGALKPEAA